MLIDMEPLSDEYLERFSQAVVQEIWNELGRQRITSLRELARRAGMTHTSVTYRMNGDARTGKQVPINVKDLAAIGDALGLEPHLFITRAQDAMNAGTDPLSLDARASDELSERRARTSASRGVAQPMTAVAREGELEPDDED